MNPSLQQLAATLLEPFDCNYDVYDIDKASLDQLHKKFQAFVDKAEVEITQLKGSDWSSIDDFYIGSGTGGFYLEHDYIMTVNGHGCGFWEEYDWEPEVGKILTKLAKQDPEIHCFVAEDSVHIEFC